MTKRRGRGEGSVYYRPAQKLWVGTISLGTGPDGKRRVKVVYGQTKLIALQKLRELQIQATTLAQRLENDALLIEWAAHWLESIVKPTVVASTYQSYAGHLRKHILPALGEVPLAKLTRSQVEQFVASIATPATAGKVLRTLRSMLASAQERGMIAMNPASPVHAPKTTKPHIAHWSATEVARFLELIREESYYALAVVAIDSGMRQGELFALRWEDVDLDKGTIHVRRSLANVGEVLQEKTTKTGKGRLIQLSKAAIAALRAAPKYFPIVFPAPMGGYLRKSNFHRSIWIPWMALAEANGIKSIRFHDLRHTCASLLLTAGVNPKIVQERLGHAKIQITLDTYSHLLPGMQQVAASAMDKVLGQK